MRLIATYHVLLVCLHSPLLSADDPKIQVSKETTFVTEPVNPDGFVDLISALNQHHSQGVEPQNNAAKIFWALGPAPYGTPLAKRFFEELDIPVPPKDGNYFVTLPEFLKSMGIEPDTERYNGIAEDQGNASMRSWNANEFPEIAAWLEINESPLQEILIGSQLTEFYCPVNSDLGSEISGQYLIATLLPHIRKMQSVARALSCRAMQRLNNGQTQAAWDDLIGCQRLGRHLSKGPFLIDALVGVSMESISNVTTAHFIGQSSPNVATAQKYLSELDQLPPRIPLAETMNWGERLVLIDLVAIFAYQDGGRLVEEEGGFSILSSIYKRNKGNMDWDFILKNANRWVDRAVVSMKLKSYSAILEDELEFDKELDGLFPSDWPSQARTGVGVLFKDKQAVSHTFSNLLIQFMNLQPHKAFKAELRVRQRFENLRVAVGLAAFRAEHQEYPEHLDALVPAYLAELPGDFFAEAPLNYQRTVNGFQLYSVGENAIDDAGVSYEDGKDDLVIKEPSTQH